MVEHLDHLGIVAEVCREIGVALSREALRWAAFIVSTNLLDVVA